jgi:hypothetical protein
MVELLAAQYGDAPPAVAGRDVWIVDFSYPRVALAAMAEQAASIRVLDHHKTAQVDLADLPFATFDMNRSGAGLAWDVLCADLGPRPWLVDYVEDRDLWRFALPNSKAINAGIALCAKDLDAWDRLFQDGPHAALERGLVALQAIDAYVRDMLQHARRVTFAGHPGIPIINAPRPNASELLHALDGGVPFAVGWYQEADGRFVYSLRSRPGGADVAAIAKRFPGGGGHTNAAGFTRPTMWTEGEEP